MDAYMSHANSLWCQGQWGGWGLAQGAMTRIEAAAAWRRTKSLVVATNQTAAASVEQARRLGRGMAASGQKRLAAVKHGGAC